MNIIRDYIVELSQYLPEFLREDPEIKAILDIESAEHRVQVEVLKDLLNQFFVDTATWGLAAFERNFGLHPRATDNYVQRRNRIFLYLQKNETVNKEYIAKLFSRYVSEDSQIKVVEDNPDNTFWVIDTGGRILYPDDLHEAIETYKPAHLRFGLQIERELTLTEEDMIRLAIASMFQGYRHIGIMSPEDFRHILNTSIVPARSGIVHIGTGPENFRESFSLGVRIGHAFTGRRDIGTYAGDLPDVFREETARLAPILGFATAIRGVRLLPLAEPETGKIILPVGAAIHTTGIRQYGLAPPESGILLPAVGFFNTYGGRKDIGADKDDLPEWFKDILGAARAAEYIGTAGRMTGQKRIHLTEPEAGAIPLASGFWQGIFGTTSIGIDRGDLPQEFTEQLTRAAAILGIGIREQGWRRIAIASPEEAETHTRLGFTGKWSGTRTIPLAMPESAKAHEGIGFAEARGGQRDIAADLADLPEWFRNALNAAQAAAYFGTALYMQGRRQTSLTRPEEATEAILIGSVAERSGKREIGIDRNDLPDYFKNILEDAGIFAYLGMDAQHRGGRRIGIAALMEESVASLAVGLDAKKNGTATIRADPDDLPEWFKDILAPSRAALSMGLTIRKREYKKIHIDAPEEGRAAVGIAIVETWGGKRSIIPAAPEDGKLGVNIALANSIGGRRDIIADASDLPEAFKNILDAARAAAFIGAALSINGVRKTSLALPEEATGAILTGSATEHNGKRNIAADLADLPEWYKGEGETARLTKNVGIKAMQSGRKRVGIVSESDTAATLFSIGQRHHISGKRDIAADHGDLPKWYYDISEPSRAALPVAVWTGSRGARRLKLAEPEEERTKLYEGTAGAITGYVVVGADLSDLNPPRRRRILPHVGTMAAG